MAILAVGFDEMGGISEFNGMTVNHAESAIINKAGDFLENGKFNGIELESLINWDKSKVDFVTRCVLIYIELRTLH